MLQAKSMYFGGDIVCAKECNYNSYVRLGLKCPFCNCAVFLRSASSRIINGIEKPITAYFAHFASGSNDNWDCEARAKTKAGGEEIERVKTEARNQRLKIYNDKLWQIIKDDANIERQFMIHANKVVGEKWIASLAKLVKKEISQNLKKFYDSINPSVRKRDQKHIDALAAIDRPDIQSMFEQDDDKRKKYFESCDTRLHKAICCEVIEFLITPSGTWAFNKMLTLSCYIDLTTASLETPKKSIKDARNIISPYKTAEAMIELLTDVPWTQAIDRLNNKL